VSSDLRAGRGVFAVVGVDAEVPAFSAALDRVTAYHWTLVVVGDSDAVTDLTKGGGASAGSGKGQDEGKNEFHREEV
jgi:hypothetical protein|tara:strand:- start:227 stop:457 length:231 start_codon:yes stop_codon:yes gene_type:complete